MILWSEISWDYQLGGCRFGGYVNNAEQDNPTFEFFPPNGPPIISKILSTTLPANLFPLTWLLPSGRLVLQSNWATSLLNYTSHEETPLDDIPDAVRVYPASAGTVMLPLRAANNWTATILLCGGSNVQPERCVSWPLAITVRWWLFGVDGRLLVSLYQNMVHQRHALPWHLMYRALTPKMILFLNPELWLISSSSRQAKFSLLMEPRWVYSFTDCQLSYWLKNYRNSWIWQHELGHWTVLCRWPCFNACNLWSQCPYRSALVSRWSTS